MKRSKRGLRATIASAVTAGILSGVLMNGSAWGQAPDTKDKAPPPPPAADKDKPASDKPKDLPKDPPKDAPKDAPRNSDKDAPKAPPKDPPRDAPRNAPKDTPSTTPKDAPRDTPRDNPRDANKDARDPARDTKDTRPPARDTKDARDTRDTRPATDRNTRDADRNTRDADRNVRDADRNTNTRDTNVNTRDTNVNASASFRADSVRPADIGLWFDRSARDGLVISDIASSGAITKLGFRTGDRIVSVNGQRVTRDADFIQYLFADDVRTKRVEVIVLRDGREETILVEPAVLVEEYSYVENDPLEHFGVILDDRYTDRLVVWRVVPRSPAYYAGIRAGDTLVSYRGQKVPGVKEFTTMLQSAQPGPVPLEVRRDQQVRQFEVDVPQYTARSSRYTNDRVNVVPGAERRQERREERQIERNARPR